MKRIILKATVYRIAAIISTLCITFILTHDMSISIKLSIVLEAYQFIFYILFEKVWSQ